MEELFRELVEVWPGDSEWHFQYSVADDMWEIIHKNVGMCVQYWQRPADIWPDFDTTNAPARNIIEDELIRLGCRDMEWDFVDEFWLLARFKKADMPEITSGMGCKSRTEALLRVAIQAFKEGTGEKP